MEARKYDTKINIYELGTVEDGYGGSTPTEILVKSVWAKVQTSAGKRFSNFGISDYKMPVIFSVRGYKNGISYNENNYVLYKGNKFFIKGIEDVDLKGLEINLYCDMS